jgi:hypothetical protein
MNLQLGLASQIAVPTLTMNVIFLGDTWSYEYVGVIHSPGFFRPTLLLVKSSGPCN